MSERSAAAPEGVTCTISVHPCGGDTVSVYTRAFESAGEATAALAAALDAGVAFTITAHQPDQPAATRTVVLHPQNIALIQVQASDQTATGQYL